MTVEKVICDECGRVKDHANHWHKIWVNGPTLVLGDISGVAIEAGGYDISAHDLCGEACFYRHIGKLLKLNPVVSE